MQSLSKYDKEIKYLLYEIDLFSKYAWGVPLNNIRGITIANAFKKNSDSSKRKPSKIWLDQNGEFYNKLFKRFLGRNKIETYSRYNEGKSVVAERFIRTLKNKIFKHMTAVVKNVYFDVLHDIFNKYNNTVHRTIKMKPIDVISHSYDEYKEDSNEKDPKFKVGGRRISKYKNIFAKRYTQNWSEEVFIITEIKNLVSWTYAISDLNGDPVIGGFYEKEWQKTSQEKFRVEKVIKTERIL